MTIIEAKNELTQKLSVIYDRREAENIAEMVLEKLTGLDRIGFLLQKSNTLEESAMKILNNWTSQLLAHRPVQYVLREAWFGGFNFFVAEGVLIPRPETDELVQWILENISNKGSLSILDIGTGSGCIAISLSKKRPDFSVFAIDKSKEALAIAQKNNQQLGTSVSFLETDILACQALDFTEKLDIIVSNPPYIKNLEKAEMRPNVLKFEPEIALFVSDNDPLLFYRKIAQLATHSLKKGGQLYFEINELFGSEIVALLDSFGFTQIELKKDMQDKDRMIKAEWHII